jgi:hypothetical protein
MKTFSTSIGVWIQVQMLQSMVSDPSVNMNPKPNLYLEKVLLRNGDDFGGGGGGGGGGRFR